MRFAQIQYVMASYNTREHYVVAVYDGGREVVHTLRLFTGDYDYAPSYCGALEAAYEVAELMAGESDLVFADDVSVNDIIAGLMGRSE